MRSLFYIILLILSACASSSSKKAEEAQSFTDKFRLEHPDFSHVSSCEWKTSPAGIYALAFNLKKDAQITVLNSEKIYFQESVKLNSHKGSKEEDFLNLTCESFQDVKNLLSENVKNLNVKPAEFAKISPETLILTYSKNSSKKILFYYFDGASFQPLAQILPKVNTNGKRHN